MPNPTQSDLHINVPLTNVSVAYMMDRKNFIADKIFPRVPVQKQSDLYWKYTKSDWRRTDAQKRAPGTETVGTGWKTNTGQYYAHVWGVHKDIDDQVRANADSFWSLDKDATLFVTNQLLLRRDLDWNDKFFKTGVWAKDYTGVAAAPTSNQFLQWNNAASDPIVQFANLQTEFILQAGRKANTLVLGAEAITTLKNHPDIIDRIKYTQRGVVTEDLLASLFDVEKILVSYASVTNVAERADGATQDAAATYSFMSNSKAAWLGYSPSSPSLMTPAAGYIFTWNGYLAGNAYGIRMKNFRMEHIAADRIEGEMTYDMNVVSPDMGIFLASAVA
jgi:hypothetical protein